ncbi:hypothetical protein KIL84_011235 [Mauremys mutica]|uniref:Uncharacterized protein n=1 Tax=Mauremys mutica TaxID=74926 RepID=A0A9D3XDW1_9SAUR|nr:hypothetical protein KIL84_011235 [Mauremys mutica]
MAVLVQLPKGQQVCLLWGRKIMWLLITGDSFPLIISSLLGKVAGELASRMNLFIIIHVYLEPPDQKPKPGLGYPVTGTISGVAEYWSGFFQAASFIVNKPRILHTLRTDDARTGTSDVLRRPPCGYPEEWTLCLTGSIHLKALIANPRVMAMFQTQPPRPEFTQYFADQNGAVGLRY